MIRRKFRQWPATLCINHHAYTIFIHPHTPIYLEPLYLHHINTPVSCHVHSFLPLVATHSYQFFLRFVIEDEPIHHPIAVISISISFRYHPLHFQYFHHTTLLLLVISAFSHLPIYIPSPLIPPLNHHPPVIIMRPLINMSVYSWYCIHNASWDKSLHTSPNLFLSLSIFVFMSTLFSVYYY